MIFTTSFLSGGCDNGTQTIQIQDIVEFKWQADGNALFGLEQKYSTAPTSTQPGIQYTLVRFNSDGSLAQTYNISPKSRLDYSNSLFISGDGNIAVTQLEFDLYRFNTKTETLEKLQTQIHLITVSPDLHYAVGTSSPDIQPIKTVNVYDINTSPARLVSHFDAAGVDLKPGVWLNDGTFGISIIDSVGRHISIYDTAGTRKAIINGADLAFHNFVFFPQTNHLYVRKWSGSLSPVNQSVVKVDLTTMTNSSLINVAVENFDITQDENIIIYSAYDSSSSIHLKSRNLTSQNETSIATDILRIISLSPSEDKLAYVRGNANQNEIHVISFSKP